MAGMAMLATSIFAAENLANKDNVKASEKQKEVPGLFDANHQTSWRTYYTSNAKASFTVDLGKEGKFNAIYIFAGNLKDYTLQSSTDGNEWKDLGKLNKFDTNAYGKVFPKKIEAQFVKLNMLGPKKNTAIIVNEFGVLDIAVPSKALYKNITLKSSQNTNWRYPAGQAVDGNLKTYFGTYSGWKGGEIEIDLGKKEEISEVDFIKVGGGITKIKIYVSNDRKEWKKAGTAFKNRKTLNAKFDKVKGRYLKLEISSGKAGNIGEIVVK